jgi:hypothetical protein
VTYLGGVAGERLRGELATVIRDLLKWAATTHVREGWNIANLRMGTQPSATGTQTRPRPPRVPPDDADLLNALPYLAFNLAHAPEDLMRRLFEIVQLNVRLHQESDDVTIKITLPADMLPDVAEAAERIENTMHALHRLSPREGTAKGVEAVRAPNGIRTRATALKGRRPGPLDDEG